MKTFLDSGVLLLAWRGGSPRAAKAKEILASDSREFLTSDNVRLELLPKPTFEKRRAEVGFFNEHFDQADRCEPFSAALGLAALALAGKYGLAAGDALNLAAAIRLGADEFITSELPGKPMFRVNELRVVSLHE